MRKILTFVSLLLCVRKILKTKNFYERIFRVFPIYKCRDYFSLFKSKKMTEDFILFTIFWAIFLLTATAAEKISDVFKKLRVSRYNQEFARDLIVKKELSRLI